MAELIFTEDEYKPEDHYPPVGTEESGLVLIISADNFTVLEHTGRFMHGQRCCAGFDGEEIGLQDVPDEPGYWVFRDGKVSAGEDYADLYCDWAPAQPEDFARFGVELPSFYYPSIVDIVRFYSKHIQNGRTIRNVFDFAQDEMVELEVEIGLAERGEPSGDDGEFGEAIDGIACLLDLIFLKRPDVTNQEISAYMQRKCEKWAKKYA